MKHTQGKYFGELLARKGIGFTQISEKIGVSYQLVQQYTTGRSTPTEDKMIKMAKILNLPLWYMYEHYQEKLLQLVKSIFVSKEYFIIERSPIHNSYVDLLCLQINPQLMVAVEIGRSQNKKDHNYLDNIKQALAKKHKITDICVFGIAIGDGRAEVTCVGKEPKLLSVEELSRTINKV